MTLSDRDLRAALQDGRIVIDPEPADTAIQPASIDVHLHGLLLLDQRAWSPTWRKIDLTDRDNAWELEPGQFALASTIEHVTVPDDMLCLVHGRSSVARDGLIVHSAGLVDPGFKGTITLELCNLGSVPFPLIPGMGIAQLTFEWLSSPAARPYGARGLASKYQAQRGATPARTRPLEEQ